MYIMYLNVGLHIKTFIFRPLRELCLRHTAKSFLRNVTTYQYLLFVILATILALLSVFFILLSMLKNYYSLSENFSIAQNCIQNSKAWHELHFVDLLISIVNCYLARWYRYFWGNNSQLQFLSIMLCSRSLTCPHHSNINEERCGWK